LRFNFEIHPFSVDIHTFRVYALMRRVLNAGARMSRRVNVVLPDETVQVLDRIAPKGNRSRLISDAVMYYVSSRGKSNLAKQLKAGYQQNTQRDIEIAQEWFPLEEEAWQKNTTPRASRKK
jgi:CopG family transcriptional regulator / antitoxin EndoAI